METDISSKKPIVLPTGFRIDVKQATVTSVTLEGSVAHVSFDVPTDQVEVTFKPTKLVRNNNG